MTFRRTELVDLQASFPVLGIMQDATPCDLLIVVNGFEERTTRYLKLLSEAGLTVLNAVTIRFETNKDENASTLQELELGLHAIGAANQFVDVSEIESVLPMSIDNARQGMSARDQPIRVVFDISGASGRVILRVVRTLFELARVDPSPIQLSIAYTAAIDYAPSREAAEVTLSRLRAEAQELSVATGMDIVTVGLDWDADEAGAIVEYPGQSAEGLAERAVVICGFNANRVRVALDAVDPAFNVDVPHPGVTYIAGAPPSKELSWRLGVMKEINSFGADPAQFDFIDVSTLQYMETLDALESVYKSGFGNERITVIPFGSKMQTLAVALFCELHPDVRAQLVAPARYAGVHYSDGSGITYALTFGDLKSLAEKMSALGALTYVAREGALTGWTSSTSH